MNLFAAKNLVRLPSCVSFAMQKNIIHLPSLFEKMFLLGSVSLHSLHSILAERISKGKEMVFLDFLVAKLDVLLNVLKLNILII